MDKFHQFIYFTEMRDECEAALSAMAAFNNAVAERSAPVFFMQARLFVHHAAAVSRMLWPPKPRNSQARTRAMARSDALQHALGLSGQQDHPVASRKLRDHFEHFDERLDNWVAQNTSRPYLRTQLGRSMPIEDLKLDTRDLIHRYDPTTRIYAFCGEEFNLQELARGLGDIRRRVDTVLSELQPKSA
jgi:hypothetical protein